MVIRRLELVGAAILTTLAPCAGLAPARAQSRTIPGTVQSTASGPAKLPEGPPIGSLAIDFSLPDTTGRLVHLNDLRTEPPARPHAKPVAAAVTMLNFWAFWCDTWSAEMPSLRELAERQGEMNFRMAAVSVDGGRLPEFLRGTSRAPAPFPVLLDTGGAVSARYRIRHVPTVVLLDTDGRIRYVAYGYPGNEVIVNQLRRLINRSARDSGDQKK